MHPTGWKKHCHYWNTKQEAVKAFKLHGQRDLPIDAQELFNLKEQEAWGRDQADEEFLCHTNPGKTQVFDPFDL
jgi:hypothetical protein